MLETWKIDFAVRTTIYLARNPDHIASAAEIAHAMHIPGEFSDKNFIKTSMVAIQGPACIIVCNVDSKRCKKSRVMHRPSG